jgi:hypothetical protein
MPAPDMVCNHLAHGEQREELLGFDRPVEVRYGGMGRASFSGLSRPQGFSITRLAANMVVTAILCKYAFNRIVFCQGIASLADCAYHLARWLYKDLFRDLPPHFPAPLPR